MENPYSAPQAPLTAESVAEPASEVRRMFVELDTPSLRRIVRASQSIFAVGQLLMLCDGMVLLILSAIFWDNLPGLLRDETSLITTVCALFAIVAAVGISRRVVWARYAGILICAAMCVGIVVLFARVFWFSGRENLWQNLGITAIFSLPAIIPGLALNAFLRHGELFGPNRMGHRELVQELAYRTFRAQAAWTFGPGEVAREDRLHLLK